MAEDLQRILECPMCLEFYDGNQRVPKLLQCQHTFCFPCISQLEKRHIITCPQCRQDQHCPPGGAAKIANNFTMLALVEVHQKSATKSPGVRRSSLESSPQSVVPSPVAQPQVSENVRNAIANLAQKLQERSNVIKSFDNKEQKTKESFLSVKKEIEANFDLRIKDLIARRDTLIKQLGEIGKEELNFIQAQKSSALQYLTKFQDDFLKMKQIFQSGATPSEMQLMQLLNMCQGYYRQIDDYALNVDKRTCDLSYSSPTLEQLLISINSYGCLTVTKQNKSLIKTSGEELSPQSIQSPNRSTTSNPFQSPGHIENRYESHQNQHQSMPVSTPTFNRATHSPPTSQGNPRSASMTRHLSLDMATSHSFDPQTSHSSPMTSASHSQRRRPMSTSFSTNVLSTTLEENASSNASSPSSTRSSSPALNLSGPVNRSRSSPSLAHMQGGTPLRPSSVTSLATNHMQGGTSHLSTSVVSPVTNHMRRVSNSGTNGAPVNIIGPDVTGRSIFEKPSGVSPLAGGMLAIVDEIKHCLMIVTDKGQMVQVLGSQGNGVGEFQFPKAICTSPDGNYIISDWWNHRIQIWDRQGRSLGHFGTRGNGQHHLNGPVGVACDPHSNIFVCDFNNHCVKVFTNEGKFTRQIGKEGTRDGHFLNPSGIALSTTGEVLVTDSGKHCVQVFTMGGTYLYRFGDWGAEPGQLNCPSGIAVGQHGYIYVANRGNHRIEVFNPSGSYAKCYGTHGSEVGQFDEPMGITVLEDGRIAVCDSGNKRIQMVLPG